MANGYSGDISVDEAWQRLQDDSDTVLLDVRTRPEWQFVGLPDLASIGKKVVLVEWQRYPDGGIDPDFVAAVERESVGKDAVILTICRSGVRSAAAAAALTAAGFATCFNVADGFEGPMNASGQRGSAAGWKAAGLPWRQS